jgi:hypothetical protein
MPPQERRRPWEPAVRLLLALLGMGRTKPSKAAAMKTAMEVALEVVVLLDAITARLVRVMVGTVVVAEVISCQTRATMLDLLGIMVGLVLLDTMVDFLDMMMAPLDMEVPPLDIMEDPVVMVEDLLATMKDLLAMEVPHLDTT